jgi:hypothetical protein
MSDAPEFTTGNDPRFRTPKTRMGLILILPIKDGTVGTITITETLHGGEVRLERGGIERGLSLSVSDLRALAEHANRIATKVSKRPDWKP